MGTKILMERVAENTWITGGLPLTGKAITYAYTKWDNIMRCLDDGRLYWDDNLAENVQRPITLSRKNFLFCGNHEAAVNMSVICNKALPL